MKQKGKNVETTVFRIKEKRTISKKFRQGESRVVCVYMLRVTLELEVKIKGKLVASLLFQVGIV